MQSLLLELVKQTTGHFFAQLEKTLHNNIAWETDYLYLDRPDGTLNSQKQHEISGNTEHL